MTYTLQDAVLADPAPVEHQEMWRDFQGYMAPGLHDGGESHGYLWLNKVSHFQHTGQRFSQWHIDKKKYMNWIYENTI